MEILMIFILVDESWCKFYRSFMFYNLFFNSYSTILNSYSVILRSVDVNVIGIESRYRYYYETLFTSTFDKFYFDSNINSRLTMAFVYICMHL
jgi:ABC-type transport system involved in multi-copper enzyme maturation permease subunit